MVEFRLGAWARVLEALGSDVSITIALVTGVPVALAIFQIAGRHPTLDHDAATHRRSTRSTTAPGRTVLTI